MRRRSATRKPAGRRRRRRKPERSANPEGGTMGDFVNLTGKTILVTGGSRGIGEGIVRGLAKEGANVVLNYTRSRKEAERIADEIGRDRCLPLGADLTDWRQLERLWQQSVAWKGRVDVLVNNAA